MIKHRLFVPQDFSVGQSIKLDSNASNYLARVLRLKIGQEIYAFNGELPLGDYRARLISINKQAVEIEILEFIEKNNESPLKINLLQGVSKGERMDYTIQKAVELGANAVFPIMLDRTMVKFSDPKRLQKKIEHWQAVSHSAAEQSGRSLETKIYAPQKLSLAHTIPADLKLCLDPKSDINLASLTKQNQAKSIESINILIGPEGGLSPEEIAQANELGYQGIQIGPRILRTETAGLAVISNLQYIWGDF